jgi:tRNA U55 pseudouridine synthase TruB
VREAFEKFRGDFYQMPPMVSAIKQGGVPLYKLARQGKTVEREPRLVHVYSYAISRIESPEIDFSVSCSKGFYVRTYAHDIGESLGCGAHLKDLRRTRSGRFVVSGPSPSTKSRTRRRSTSSTVFDVCRKSRACAAPNERSEHGRPAFDPGAEPASRADLHCDRCFRRGASRSPGGDLNVRRARA